MVNLAKFQDVSRISGIRVNSVKVEEFYLCAKLKYEAMFAKTRLRKRTIRSNDIFQVN